MSFDIILSPPLGVSVETGEIANGAVTTAKIADSQVTYAKIQNVTATGKLLGRTTAGAGVIEEITYVPITTYTPTVSSSAGTFTATKSAFYERIGNSVRVWAVFTSAQLATAVAAVLSFSGPPGLTNSANTGSMGNSFSYRWNGVSGTGFVSPVANGTTINMLTDVAVAGTWAVSSGNTIAVFVAYQVTT